jgi:ABC-type oligopeptide transport system substrate-binding subunit
VDVLRVVIAEDSVLLREGVARLLEDAAAEYERVKDFWGKDLNINIGRDNFDEIRYEYFRDTTVALEAFKGDNIDWRTENSARVTSLGLSSRSSG